MCVDDLSAGVRARFWMKAYLGLPLRTGGMLDCSRRHSLLILMKQVTPLKLPPRTTPALIVPSDFRHP
jgi:hypothetical protein